MMTIRLLTEKDIPVLREMAIRIYKTTFAADNTAENMEAFLQSDYSIEKFEEEFDEPDAPYFFAEENEQPAAYLRLRINHEAEKYLGRNTIELHRLYVDTAFQGKGAGTLLMEHALRIATARKVDWIWLGVWERNWKAQKFYQNWGFERFSEHVFQMGDDAQTDWLLRKQITLK